MKKLLMMFAFFVACFISLSFVQSALAEGGMDACAKQCETCSAKCTTALKHVEEQSKGKQTELSKVLADCTQICKTSEGFLKRGSQFHPKTCGVCSTICAKCAELCEKSNDKALKDCAQECRKCEASCKKMAG